MEDYTKKRYTEYINENGFILTFEAKEKYEEFLQKWKNLLDKLPEEKNDIKDLYKVSNELINISCIDHFVKGYRTGSKVTYGIFDKFDFFAADQE